MSLAPETPPVRGYANVMLCDDCWVDVMPHRVPARFIGEQLDWQRCYRCRVDTASGIYLRVSLNEAARPFTHRLTQPYPRRGPFDGEELMYVRCWCASDRVFGPAREAEALRRGRAHLRASEES